MRTNFVAYRTKQESQFMNVKLCQFLLKLKRHGYDFEQDSDNNLIFIHDGQSDMVLAMQILDVMIATHEQLLKIVNQHFKGRSQ